MLKAKFDESVSYFFKLLEAMDVIIDKWVYKDKDGVIHEDVQKKGKGFSYKSGIRTIQIPPDEINKVRLEPFLKKSR